MRLLIIFACFSIIQVITDSNNGTDEFVPIGKDLTPAPPTQRPLPKSVGSVVSHKVFTEDGIKYTEIVRKTPLGGTQIAHIKGDVSPSLLPVPMPIPDISKFMKKLATRIEVIRQEPVIEQSQTPIHPIIASRPQMGPPVRREEARVEEYTSNDGPIIYRPYDAPPQYPNFMMYPPESYGLLGRVGSMTGSILDNVMDFVVGRRRR